MKNWLKETIKRFRKSRGSVAKGNYAPAVIGIDAGKEESYSATIVRQGDRLTQVVLGDDFWDRYLDCRLRELSGLSDFARDYKNNPFQTNIVPVNDNTEEVCVNFTIDGDKYEGIKEVLDNLKNNIISAPEILSHLIEDTHAFPCDCRMIIRESMHRWESGFFGLPPDLLAETTELYRRQLAEAGTWRPLPTEAIAPENIPEQRCCTNCKHNHDRSYNGIEFFCAMHPYGWQEAGTCPDREGLDEF